MGNKGAGLVVGGIASAGSIVGGVTLMVAGGPYVALVGGVLMSGGISGGVNTVSQGFNDNA